jgi:hypothetical protein
VGLRDAADTRRHEWLSIDEQLYAKADSDPPTLQVAVARGTMQVRRNSVSKRTASDQHLMFTWVKYDEAVLRLGRVHE